MKKYKTTIFIYCLTLFMIFVFNVDAPKTLGKYISTKSDSINLKIDKPTYTITFDANGGTGTMEDMELTYGQTVLLNANAFSKPHFIFAKWNTESDGSGDDYYNLQEVSNLSSVNEDVITLYAQWEDDGIREYHVVHQKMKLDGTYEIYEEQTLTGHMNTTITITPYTFTGFITPDPVELFIEEDNSSEAIINYDRETYTLTVENYDLLDSSSTVSGDYYYETPVTLIWASLPGYIFEKWSNDETNETTSFVLTEDTTIGPVFVEMKSYFVEYDGINEFMGFTKDSEGALNIKHFERNTTLTEEEVLALSNVQIVSTSEDDPDYPSNTPIYGWIDNDTFYWWSETPTVTFHPETRNAFSHYAELLTVDLTGTTTEEVKNFSHWFDTDRKLTTITGKIVTTGQEMQTTDFNFSQDSNTDTSSHTGMSYLFNDCNALTTVDLSGLDTKNAIDMKRMFAGTNKLANIDLSHFDTSNVRSMYWMFRNAQSMTSIDLSSFNTSNVENMYGMFVNANKVETVTLGENFDTSKVKKMGTMFTGMTKLKTIYAEVDFVRISGLDSSSMFANDTLLIGGAGTVNETPFNSSRIDKTYAQIANSSQNGYFTYIGTGERYTITYNLNGGTASNPTVYSSEYYDITLSSPTKPGFIFTGWTGSNGNTPELVVTIPTGSTGNKSYVAHYEAKDYEVTFNSNFEPIQTTTQTLTYGIAENLDLNPFTKEGYQFVAWNTESDGSGDYYYDGERVTSLTQGDSITLYAQWELEGVDTFPKVFEFTGSCTFNGGGLITGCEEYEDQTYIDTGIQLFNSNNYLTDFEIYFEITDYNPNNQTAGGQETMMNAKLENKSLGYPGLVFRRSGNNLEITQTINGTKVSVQKPYATVHTVKILRRNRVIYYSFNGGELELLQDTTGLDQQFVVPVWFGASMDVNGNPMRYLTGTLSNMYIKLGVYAGE